MTAEAPVSLIVVSRHRPDCLTRCLTAVAQMDHPNFEVIVVADPGSIGVTDPWPVRRVPFDLANISAARNAGIAAAAGEILAFIDDDAVPEPRWLWHLTRPFADPSVAAAGGFVLGWNGISHEWRGGTVDRLLNPGGLALPMDATSLHRASPGLAIEVKGVNAAYRRSVIAPLGGFDPALAYYLDETELNLRLAGLGATIAVVPGARVQHRKAESPRRTADRTPVSLWDIGASSAVTLRRHGATEAEVAAARDRMLAHEAARLARLSQAGRLAAGASGRLMAGLAQGFADGLARPLPPLAPLAAPPSGFLRFASAPRALHQLGGPVWRRAALMAEARRLVAAGGVVQLCLFGPTARFHQRRFHDGYWLQTGGLFGKSDRSDPLFRLWRPKNRHIREMARFVAGFRNT